MTGLGVGTAPLEGGRVIVELRALNHRFQDVRVRVPPSLADHAFFLEQAARQKLGRGRYDVSVRTEGAGRAEPRLSVERAEAVYRALCALRDRLAPGSEVPLTAVLGIPEVLLAEAPETEQARASIEQALSDACESLSQMRRTEGAALESDLRGRVQALWGLHARLAERIDQIALDYKQRLGQRLARLLDDGRGLATERLEQEVAILADRSDITEELVRLASHLTQFGDLLGSSEAVGRRLDFLLQEIGREVNTIGAKAQHTDQSRWVVEAKAEVERLREQVQNVD